MIAILPIQEAKEDSTISLRFSRSPYFAIINKGKGEYRIQKNPFIEEKVQVGKQIFVWLTGQFRADTFIAFELGLNLQQMASRKKMQLIILNKKNTTLQGILRLMKMSVQQ